MNKKILFPLDKGLPSSTKYGASLSLTIDDEYIISGQLLDQNGDALGEKQTLDLPLESVVVDGSYDAEDKTLVLILNNGNTTSIPVGDLIEGLQAEITSENKLSADLVDDSSSENKFVTETQKIQIETNKNNIASLELNKVDKTIIANKVYGTDNSGNQTTYNKEELGQIIQYSTVPTATSSLVGTIIQYTGATTVDYTNGYFYKCVDNSSVYSWEEIVFGSIITVDSSLSTVSENPVQNKVITNALNNKSTVGIARLI